MEEITSVLPLDNNEEKICQTSELSIIEFCNFESVSCFWETFLEIISSAGRGVVERSPIFIP